MGISLARLQVTVSSKLVMARQDQALRARLRLNLYGIILSVQGEGYCHTLYLLWFWAYLEGEVHELEGKSDF